MKKKRFKNRLTAHEIERIKLLAAALDGRLGNEAQELVREGIARLVGKEGGFGKAVCGNA